MNAPRKRLTLATVLLAATAGISTAQTQVGEQKSAEALNLASALCLMNYATPDRMVPAFQQAGFKLTPGMDAGVFDVEAPGLWGVVQPGQGESYCMFQAMEVRLELGIAIAHSLAGHYFPGAVQEGGPEGATECPTLSVFAPQRLIVIEIANPGNDIFCNSPSGSAIILRM